MIKLLVSACLIGERVRYNGVVKSLESSILAHWQLQGRVVPFCPEVAAGLPVPRPSAEITGGDGGAVLRGYARVRNVNSQDVTKYFLDGAQKALELARSLGIKLAVLKEGSPSCGSTYIYDGSFSGTQKQGRGVTSFLLEEKGIRVFSEREITEAAAYLKILET
ncbi:MAG: purine-nucleoside phosphorylase [Desulfobacterales bacterium PC51MH44]|nr:MAG: purine-nucleoside phosphorylase [Desulfobacterales bacterium PC51MH44]